MLKKTKRVALGVAVLAALAGAGTANAQQLNPGISCIEGDVGPVDWAELSSQYKESMWDTKASVKLEASGDQLELQVTDFYGNTVCEQTAEMKTKCKFNFPASYAGIFNIRIDNKMSVPSRFKLCAE